MKISEQGIALIKKFEGFSEDIYICPAGKATIGYGHAVLPYEYNLADRISVKDAEDLLEKDLNIVEQAISGLVKSPLSQNQFDALCSFIYNVGVRAFSLSTMLRMINAKDMKGAAGQFSRWVYSGGKKLEGLVNRRAEESKLFLKTAKL